MYQGEDCPGQDIHDYKQVETIGACVQYCKTYNGCNAVTWVPGDDKKCLLKNNNCDNHTVKSSLPGIVSARVSIGGTTTTSSTTTAATTTVLPTTMPLRTLYSSGSLETEISTNTVAHGLTICEDWDLSIDLFLPSQQPTGWRNIFGLQVYGTGPSQAGARVPALWIVHGPHSSDLRLMASISNAVGTEPFYHYYFHITAETWFNLKLTQRNGFYQIKVNSSLIHEKQITDTKTWDNVNVVIGNFYDYQDGSHVSAVGKYRKFEINSCHDEIQNY